MRARQNKRKQIKKDKTLKIIEIGLLALIAIIAIITAVTLISIKNNSSDEIMFGADDALNQLNHSNSSSDENNLANTTKDSSQPGETIMNEKTDTPSKNENFFTTPEVTEKNPTDTTFTMAVTGDIMCHNTMYWDAYNSLNKTYDFSYMFEDIKYYIQTADIAVGNLETTFAGEKVGYSSYPTFNTPESLAPTLKKIGFDVVSTANNHCFDKGYSGIQSTIKYLDAADLNHTGTFTSPEAQNDILIKDVKGVKIAFLSFTYGTNGIKIPSDKSYSVNLIDEDLILKQLNLAKAKNPDLICVSMHWGIEYQTSPNNEQKNLADLLFNNGADVILGNHPHVPQKMEKRTIKLTDGSTKDGFVIYSLGNFMADQGKQYTRDTAILNLTFTKNAKTGKVSIDKAEYTPVYIYNSKSGKTRKFKLLDIKTELEASKAGESKLSKTTINTLTQELANIKKIIGDEIK